jgi:hypothetical protein
MDQSMSRPVTFLNAPGVSPFIRAKMSNPRASISGCHIANGLELCPVIASYRSPHFKQRLTETYTKNVRGALAEAHHFLRHATQFRAGLTGKHH